MERRDTKTARKLEEIIWIHTPRCVECEEYSAIKKKCALMLCKYPSKR